MFPLRTWDGFSIIQNVFKFAMDAVGEIMQFFVDQYAVIDYFKCR
jgi:hypothetical protein